jgi:aryl-alcohol dehydrogenase
MFPSSIATKSIGGGGMKITAAVFRAPMAPFSIETLELDEPQADEVMVGIVGVGVCHTDLVAQAGAFPISLPAVLGHEGAGIVERVGSAVTKFKRGDRVAMTFLSCGNCPSCDKHEPAYCHTMPMLNYTGLRADGSKAMREATSETRVSGNFFGQSSFASHALAHERNLVKVPEGVPLEIAGTLGCGVQTGAGAVMRSMACKVGSSIVVLGGGAVGLSAVMGSVVQSCKQIIVVEPHAARRELATSLGATHTIDPKGLDLVQAVRAILPAGADYAFDTTGQPSVVESVVGFLAPRGTFGFVGVPPFTAMDLKLPGTLLGAMQGGFTFRGIIEGDSEPDVFIPQLMSLYMEGRFPFDKLIKTYPLADINRAIQEQCEGLCVKPILLV